MISRRISPLHERECYDRVLRNTRSVTYYSLTHYTLTITQHTQHNNQQLKQQLPPQARTRVDCRGPLNGIGGGS